MLKKQRIFIIVTCFYTTQEMLYGRIFQENHLTAEPKSSKRNHSGLTRQTGKLLHVSFSWQCSSCLPSRIHIVYRQINNSKFSKHKVLRSFLKKGCRHRLTPHPDVSGVSTNSTTNCLSVCVVGNHQPLSKGVKLCRNKDGRKT